jgi:hypothetical protein
MAVAVIGAVGMGCDDEASEEGGGGATLAAFIGGSPALPGPFAGETLPIDVDAFVAAHPEHASARVDDVDKGLRFHYQDHDPSLIVYGSEHQGRVNGVDLRVHRSESDPAEDLTARLQSAWGPPDRTWSTSSGDRRCWFDDEAGVKATYTVVAPGDREGEEENFHIVELSRALSWDAVIREFRGQAGLGDEPLIGMTRDQAEALIDSLPRQSLNGSSMSPGMPIGCRESFNPTLNVVDGTVVGFQESFGWTGEDGAEELMANDMARFDFLGEPARQWDPERGELAKRYEADPPVTLVQMGPLRVTFEVGEVAAPTTPPETEEATEEAE